MRGAAILDDVEQIFVAESFHRLAVGHVSRLRIQRRRRRPVALSRRPVAADAGSVTLGFFFEFHCQRVSEPKRSALVAEVLSDLLGAPLALLCTVVPSSASESEARPRTRTDQAKQDPVVRHAVESLGARVAGVKSDS